MHKHSKLEPPLVGSVASYACGPKQTDQWPSKHYQAGRDAKERGPIDGWKKSAIFARKEDDNTTGEAVGWPKWETVSAQSCEKYSRSAGASEDDSTMACRRGWNESEDGNVKRVTNEGGDARHHDGLAERGQPIPNVRMAGKGGSSKSAWWDGPADGDEKRESGGWPTWPGASSKTTWRCTDHQNNKGCWNQPKGWTAAEDGSAMACKRGWIESEGGRGKRENGGDTFDHDGRDGWRQSRSNIRIVDKGSFSNSASWDRPKRENVKRENDGWPGAMSKPTRQCASHQNSKGYWNQAEGWAASDDSFAMACKRGWNESGDGKEKMGNGGDAFDHDGIRTVDRGGSSKPTSWDRGKDENAERAGDGWSRWPGATSKTTRQCSSHQKGWTTSEDDATMGCAKVWNDSGDVKEKWVTADVSDAFDHDGFNMVDKSSLSKPTPWDQAKGDDEKRENDEWRRWPGTASNTIGQSQGRTAPDDRNGDPWMRHGSAMPPKCDWNRPVNWNASKGDSLDRDQRKWDPALNRTGGDPWKQIRPTGPPKAGKRKFGSAAVVRVEDSITRQSKWSRVPDFSDPDASKQRRSRWGPSLSSTSGYNGNQSRKGSLEENNGRITDLDRSDDPWVEHRSMMLPQGDWKKSARWTKSGVGDFASDRRRWGPDFNEIGHDPWEQLSSPEFGDSFREGIKLGAASDFGGKRPFRGGRRPPHHFGEHEHHQSNDSYKKGAGAFSACHGDSHLGRSQRGGQVRRQIGRKHPDLLQDIGPRNHGSRNDGAAKDKPFQNDESCDTFLQERCSHHDYFEGRQGRPTKDKSRTGSDRGQSQQSAQSSNPNVQTQPSDHEHRLKLHSEPVDVRVNGESFVSKNGKEEVGANGELKGGVDDRGARMFKFALAEFVKEILKPVWREGRLSKEAHKTVVKKVVDKVVGVLGANIPQTRERIALYLSFSKDKLHKLVQDYLEMFINT